MHTTDNIEEIEEGEDEMVEKPPPQGTLKIKSYVDEEGFIYIKCSHCEQLMVYRLESFNRYVQNSNIGLPTSLTKDFVAQLTQEGCVNCNSSHMAGNFKFVLSESN